MLFNNGLDSLARLILQEASKHHIFLSQYQRPVLAHTREIETKMVWDIEQFQLSTFYRYTDQYKLAELVDFLPTMKKEALEATKHINEVVQNLLFISIFCYVPNLIFSPFSLLPRIGLFIKSKICPWVTRLEVVISALYHCLLMARGDV